MKNLSLIKLWLSSSLFYILIVLLIGLASCKTSYVQCDAYGSTNTNQEIDKV